MNFEPENESTPMLAGERGAENAINVHSSQFHTTNPRHLRVTAALLICQQPRQMLDAIAGCTNSPDLIADLRRRGLKIPCRRIDTIDRDGRKCHPGIYYLTESDRLTLTRWQSQRAEGGAS